MRSREILINNNLIHRMAQLLNRIGQLGLGVAIVGGVVNSALFNGRQIYTQS